VKYAWHIRYRTYARKEQALNLMNDKWWCITYPALPHTKIFAKTHDITAFSLFDRTFQPTIFTRFWSAQRDDGIGPSGGKGEGKKVQVVGQLATTAGARVLSEI